MKKYLTWLFGILLILAGMNHFVSTHIYVKMMPSYLPWHYSFVILSGIIEIVLGIGILLSKTRKIAAWGIIALLVAVIPAHIHMIQHSELFPQLPLWGLYARLPFQGLLGLWVWWLSSERAEEVPE